MSKSWLKFSLIFLISLFFFACAAPSIQQKNLSSKIESASRVVALTSLSADLTQRLAPDKLVGIVGSSLLVKDDRFEDIERVSLGQTPPNLEKIIALKPDLVIGAEGFYTQTMSQLEELEIATLTTNVRSWDGLLSMTKNLADRLDADPKPLLSQYQSYLQNIPEQSKSTLVIIDNRPILSPNRNSWAGDLLAQFNVNNVTASIQGESSLFRGYIPLSTEAILKQDPEIILVVNSEPDVLNRYKSDPFWGKLNATKNDRVYPFEYYGLINPGSIDRIAAVCNKLQEVLNQ